MHYQGSGRESHQYRQLMFQDSQVRFHQDALALCRFDELALLEHVRGRNLTAAELERDKVQVFLIRFILLVQEAQLASLFYQLVPRAGQFSR